MYSGFESTIFERMVKETNITLDNIDNISDDFLKSINDNLEEYDRYYKEIITDNKDYIDKIWGIGFAHLRHYYQMSSDICTSYNKYLVDCCDFETINNKEQYFCLHAINSRATQLFLEITCLLENGLGFGAIGYYRSLFEIWCVAEVIADNTNDVSKEYLKSIKVNGKNKSEKEKYKWLEKTKYFNGNYGISSLLSNAYKTIKSNSKKFVSKSKFIEAYDESSFILHPSAPGVFSRFFEKDGNSYVLTGYSDDHIYVPSINAIMTLFNINSLLLNLYPAELTENNSLMFLKLLKKWIDEKTIPAFNEINEKFQKSKSEF